MRIADCYFCGTPAARSVSSENDKHVRVECPTCGTYRLDERSHHELEVWLLQLQEAGVERPPVNGAVSAFVRATYDAGGQQEVFIDDLATLRRNANA